MKSVICQPGHYNKLQELTSAKYDKEPGYAIISTVTGYPPRLIKILRERYKVLKLTESTPLPFRNAYKTSKTLGKDRLAGIAAAYRRYPAMNVLVINAGTCLTIDFMNSKGVYQGGSISPGLEMRFKALHNFTARLPLIEPDMHYNELKGNSTRDSILSGVQGGIVEEVNGIINRYSARYGNLQIMLTGGWHEWLKKHLNHKIITEPFLTLHGLNVILRFCLADQK